MLGCAGGASGNSRVRTLNLSGNNIGDKGAALLAEMLKARPFGHATRCVWLLGVNSLAVGCVLASC